MPANDPDRPFFSVCMPTYNYAHFIGEAIESVLSQEFSDWELLVFDDCSDDDTERVVGKYAAADPRITFRRNESNLGIFGNLNRVMAAARGEFLKVLCADDAFSPACLGVIHRNLEQHGFIHNAAAVKTVMARAELMNTVAGTGLFRLTTPQTVMGMIANGEDVYPNLPSTCVRRSVFKEMGFFASRGRGLDYALDWTAWMSILMREPCVLIDSPVIFTRFHGNNAAMRLSQLVALEETMSFCRQRCDATPALPRAREALEAIMRRMVAVHLVHGIGDIFRKRDLSYLREVRQVVRRHRCPVQPGLIAAEFFRAIGRRLAGRQSS